MAERLHPGESYVNQVRDLAERSAEALGASPQVVEYCISIFPPDLYREYGGAYSSYQAQRVLNCVYVTAVDISTRGIINAIDYQKSQITIALSDISTRVSEQGQEFIIDTASTFDTLANEIYTFQRGFVDTTDSFLSGLTQQFQQTSQTFANIISFAIEGISKSLQLIVANNVNDVAALAEAVRNIVLDQTAAQTELLKSFAEGELTLSQAIEQITNLLRTQFVKQQEEKEGTGSINMLRAFASLITGDYESFEHDVSQPAATLSAIATAGGEETPIAKALFASSIPFNKIMQTVAMVIALPFSLLEIIKASLIPELNKFAQLNARINPFALLDIPAAVEGFHRGYVKREMLERDLADAGIDTDRRDILIGLYNKLIPPGELLAWWLRGLIPEQELNDRFAQAGYGGANTDLLKQAAFFIPPVQDLITMAVREAFSPDVATLFGQYEQFPEDFAKFAAQQGVSEDWAKRYWAAHWNLPSLTAGFEMFQRRVITRDELEMLLKAQDVMPFWRNKVLEISYNPLTRVDVRRMHKLGILSDEDVYNSYLDIGYSPKNADALTEFTVKYNEDVANLGDTKDLARSQILGLFAEGVISEEQSIKLLVDLGYSQDDSVLILTLEQITLQRKYRKERIDIVVAKAKKGLTTFEDAQAEIAGLGATPIELQRAMTAIADIASALTELPTILDLKAMYNDGRLTVAEFKKWLSKLGFNEYWQTKFAEKPRV